MYNELEDRIARAALAGATLAGGVAVAVFLLTGEVVVNATTSTIGLTLDPAFQGPILGALLAAGLLKVACRVIAPTGRRPAPQP